MVPVTTNQITIIFPLLLVYSLLTTINHQPGMFFHPPETWPVPDPPFDLFVSDEPLRIQPLIHHVHCIEPMEIPVWYVSGRVKKKWLQKWQKKHWKIW